MVRKRLLLLLKPFDLCLSLTAVRRVMWTNSEWAKSLLCLDETEREGVRHATRTAQTSGFLLLKALQVEEFSEVFDATRSTGYLCAATVNNFEQMLEGILENRLEPSELARMAVSLNSKLISTSALNDVLLAHPCPSVVSRFSFRITQNGEPLSNLLHSRSSGLRVSTAAGSTAAMLSAGGSAMPILSKELQYMVREPILPDPNAHLMHGFVKSDETMDITWFCREGLLYIDGSHVVHSVQHGDTIKLSSRAPTLKVYLPPHCYPTMYDTEV
ncbi:hypothetical protein DH2020_033742 [Rehmannia glutinosa]|uniref:Uncharacterized protein n=1 Tax=Rehmannia glutinosa TaxID=99300 RepID=A0ABR0VBH3_REHGL